MLKTRCKIQVDIPGGASLYFPLNQFSDDAIQLNTSGVMITNKFQLASRTAELKEYSIEGTHHGGRKAISSLNCLISGDHDCLIDITDVVCAEVAVFETRRADSRLLRLSNFARRIPGVFDHCFFETISPKKVLNKLFDLKLALLRNLSSFISHNGNPPLLLKQTDLQFPISRS